MVILVAGLEPWNIFRLCFSSLSSFNTFTVRNYRNPIQRRNVVPQRCSFWLLVSQRCSFWRWSQLVDLGHRTPPPESLSKTDHGRAADPECFNTPQTLPNTPQTLPNTLKQRASCQAGLHHSWLPAHYDQSQAPRYPNL